MNLFINTSADPSASLVNSLIDNSNTNLQSLFLGDSLPLKVCFTDGNGNYADWNGESGLSVKVGIGLLSKNELFILSENFIYSNNSYSGNLVLSTTALATALDGFDLIDAVFEIQVNRANGESITTLQVGCTIYNQLIGSSTLNPDPNQNDYFPNDQNYNQTKNELDAYVLDYNKVPEVGDIIRLLTEISSDFLQGSYSIINSISSSSPIYQMRNADGYTAYFNDTSHLRGRNWEIVNPSNQITILDSDSDGVADEVDYFANDLNYTQTKAELDSYSLDTYKTPQVGDIVRILVEVNASNVGGNLNYDFKVGDYHIVSYVGNNTIRLLHEEEAYVLNISQKEQNGKL